MDVSTHGHHYLGNLPSQEHACAGLLLCKDNTGQDGKFVLFLQRTTPNRQQHQRRSQHQQPCDHPEALLVATENQSPAGSIIPLKVTMIVVNIPIVSASL